MKNRFIPNHNDHSYYPLLFKAIKETGRGTIIECGMGYGSTPLLGVVKTHKTISYETNKEWADKFDKPMKFLIEGTEWVNVMKLNKDAEIIFIDQAPGESRKDCLEYLLKDFKGIVVAHDTEPAADYGYQMRQYLTKFNYRVEVKTSGAWATAVSNHIDLTKWVGEKFGDYEISL